MYNSYELYIKGVMIVVLCLVCFCTVDHWAGWCQVCGTVGAAAELVGWCQKAQVELLAGAALLLLTGFRNTFLYLLQNTTCTIHKVFQMLDVTGKSKYVLLYCFIFNFVHSLFQ